MVLAVSNSLVSLHTLFVALSARCAIPGSLGHLSATSLGTAIHSYPTVHNCLSTGLLSHTRAEFILPVSSLRRASGVRQPWLMARQPATKCPLPTDKNRSRPVGGAMNPSAYLINSKLKSTCTDRCFVFFGISKHVDEVNIDASAPMR